MELTPGVIVIIAVVVVVGFVLIRRAGRHEAAAPLDGPAMSLASNTMVARDGRASAPLVEWLLERASEQTGVRLDGDALVRQRIAEAASKAMEDLRTEGSASITLPFLAADASGPKHFDVRFKRNVDSTFELQG